MSSTTARTALTRRSALVALAGTGLAVGPAIGAWAAPPDDDDPAPLTTPEGPDDQGMSRIPVEGVGDGRTAAWETEPFELVALTWTGDSAPEPYVRVRTDGVWSPWSALPADEHTAGGADVAGTEPLWTRGADAVEVSVAGEVPEDLSLTLVHPEPMPRSALSAPEPDATTAGVPGRWIIDKPTMASRANWGADESLRQNQDGVAYGDVRGGFVHHTATANSYSSGEVRGIIRSIYRYHVLSRDFYDIGYNFLIDRFGRIWEGAYGGVHRAVIAAHTQYYNSQSFGVAAIGNFHERNIPSRVLTAYADLFAWKFDVHGVHYAYGTGNYTNDGARRLPVISGHRDTKSTACPGQYLYARLDTIRSGTQNRLENRVKLELTGRGGSVAGTGVDLEVFWEYDGVAVDGVVRLQRRLSNGSWRNVRDFRVRNGRATHRIAPKNSQWWRVRAVSAESSQIDTSHPNGTSTWHQLRTVKSGGRTILDLSGPKETATGRDTTLYIGWISPRGGVTGEVRLQRELANGTWRTVRDIQVDRGKATTTVSPSRKTRYRVVSRGVQSPDDVPRRVSYLYTLDVW
ncbi:MAG TPA: N-acetylmuramoyl-L-alanine amidase [Candidatus Ruania gallistercoris]|uniref:N-acetylmuramoyl-L-alanine amidase n=1 Tax=Candidatus Ruania gallistercoris TaxID=2838746 RepID=A0A9D2EG66_9MICO|nr:N-acetylmuramoyl-L-alanine amidase [Candidatus Ruania gallistercoris]